MNFLSFFKTSDVFDPDRLAKDAEAIRRFYLKNGYADFRVIGVDPVYDPGAGGYIVTITRRRGRRLPGWLGQRRIAPERRFRRGPAVSRSASTPATPITATPSRTPSSA